MIDRVARDTLAGHLQHLASGRISRAEYVGRADTLLRSTDQCVRPIVDSVYWAYGNYGPWRYAGKHRLASNLRRELGRLILFLRSDLEYEWPAQPRWWSGRSTWKTWRAQGDHAVWPFITVRDLKWAVQKPALGLVPRPRAG